MNPDAPAASPARPASLAAPPSDWSDLTSGAALDYGRVVVGRPTQEPCSTNKVKQLARTCASRPRQVDLWLACRARGRTNSWGATGQRGGWPAPAAHFSWRTLRQTGN